MFIFPPWTNNIFVNFALITYNCKNNAHTYIISFVIKIGFFSFWQTQFRKDPKSISCSLARFVFRFFSFFFYRFIITGDNWTLWETRRDRLAGNRRLIALKIVGNTRNGLSIEFAAPQRRQHESHRDNDGSRSSSTNRSPVLILDDSRVELAPILPPFLSNLFLPRSFAAESGPPDGYPPHRFYRTCWKKVSESIGIFFSFSS